MLGRELVGETDDDRVSREHTRISTTSGGFIVEDLGSRNGTYLEGRALTGGVTALAPVIRTGRTVWSTVDDVRPFEGVPVTTRHGVTAGGTTTRIRTLLEEAAAANSHVVVFGDPGVGRGHLARSYRSLLANPADTSFEEDVSGPSADKLAARIAALEASPTRRVVFTVNRASKPLHPELEAWLRRSARWIVAPPWRARADELAAILHGVVQAHAPALTCHASVVEQCLVSPRNIGTMVDELAQTARAVAARGELVVRAEHLEAEVRSHWVIYPKLP